MKNNRFLGDAHAVTTSLSYALGDIIRVQNGSLHTSDAASMLTAVQHIPSSRRLFLRHGKGRRGESASFYYPI